VTTSRRTLLLGSAAGGLTLAGCGSDPSADPSSDAPASSPGAETRTVAGALGDIEVQGRPTRVVSVGQYRDTDAAVALGVVPLLSPDLTGFVEGGITPWVLDALDGRDLALYDAEDLPLEQVAAARPELILATDRSSLEDGEYDLLSKIAPTLSWQNGYNRDDWRTTTGRVGEALGLAPEAAGVVSKVEGAITAARSANPRLTGVTFTLGPVTAEGTVNTINSVEDASVRFFNELGLVLSPTVRGLPDASFPGRATVSAERLDLLEADVLMLTYNTPAAKQRMESDPLFTRLTAVREGRYVALDLTDALALGFPSALSIQYAVDTVLPKIVAVVG
jgi:iron complex transport system substrate-binding protein